MNLNEVIIKKRKENNLTQEELAEKLNVARQTVSKWETGETTPDFNSLKDLAITLNFSVDNIIGIEKEENDDITEWLIIGGFVIGNSIDLIFNTYILGFYLQW